MQLLLVLLVLLLGSAALESKKRVAVIGGGIGGASACFFLLQEHGVEVTLFERSATLGGRSASVPAAGGEAGEARMMEMGAGILYTGNQYLYNISLQLGLSHVLSPPRTFGFWNGAGFAFRSGGMKLATSIRMLLRYGASLLRLTRLVKHHLLAFKQLYQVQREGRAFDTPEELWKSVGLYHLTQTSIETYFRDKGLSERIITELVAAVNRVNYNQGNGMAILHYI